jgi:hypothetical protein
MLAGDGPGDFALEPPHGLLPAPGRGVIGHVAQSAPNAAAHERVVDDRLEIVVVVVAIVVHGPFGGAEVEGPPAGDLMYARLVVDEVAPDVVVVVAVAAAAAPAAAAAAADCGVIVDAMPGSTAAAIAVTDATVVDFSQPSLLRRKKLLLTDGRWCSNSLVVVGIHGRADVE